MLCTTRVVAKLENTQLKLGTDSNNQVICILAAVALYMMATLIDYHQDYNLISMSTYSFKVDSER